MNKLKCPECGSDALKVIYMGLPMKICDGNNKCQLLWGFWSFVCSFIYNGIFMTYEGNYLKALYRWLFDNNIPRGKDK